MGFIRSIRKSIKLRQLSNYYISHTGFGGNINSMMQFDQEEFIDELYNLMIFDNKNRVVIEHFKIDKLALQGKFQLLLASGCGLLVKGHLVAISAFAFFQTLEYIFSTEQNDRDKKELLAFNLINWFEDGKHNRLVDINYVLLD